MRTAAAAVLTVAVVALIAVGVDATIVWQSTGTLTTGVVSPPATFEAGNGASKDRYISAFTLTTNKTSFTATFTARAGADVTVKDVAGIVSQRASALTVTLRGTQIVNANILSLTWTIKNGSSTVATMNMLSPSPSVAFTLPPSETFDLDLRVKLTPGSGSNNAIVDFGLGAQAD